MSIEDVPMATEIQAPGHYNPKDGTTIFLAGSIDQGKESTFWQSKVVKALANVDVMVLNPRRDDWSSDWEQDAHAEPFRSQVLWEKEGMESADLIFFCFTKDSKAPISMYELGRYGNTKDCIVCVEEGFYRQGNLDLYCEFDHITIWHDLDEAIADLRTVLEKRT